MPEAKPVLAIDLGGTKIAAAVIDGSQVVAREYVPTLAAEGPEAVISRIFTAADRLLGAGKLSVSKLDSVSIAAAGGVSNDGVITSSPNLPGWSNVPLRDIVRKRYGVDVFVVNDASAAALGEHRLGAGRGTKNLVYLTVSTGIGGGIIINGRLYLGAGGCAGEVGHMTVDINGAGCACGSYGCLEVLASGTAVAKEAIRRIGSGEKSTLAGMVGKPEDITAEKVAEAARGGDGLAADVIRRAAAALGVGLVNVANIFNPEMIVIGGGMSKMGEMLLAPAREVVMSRAFKLCAQAVRIVPAQLGDDAGLLGAAVFAREQKAGRHDEGS